MCNDGKLSNNPYQYAKCEPFTVSCDDEEVVEEENETIVEPEPVVVEDEPEELQETTPAETEFV